MPKPLRFRKPRPDQVLAMLDAQAPPPARAPAAGPDITERAARAWALIAARRPELREFDPGIDPWGAVEFVRDAFECGDLPDALHALRGAAADWLAGLAPAAEWTGGPGRGLSFVRFDSARVLNHLHWGKLRAAELLRLEIRSATYDVRTQAELRPAVWPHKHVRLASDWAVWCRRARCALVWLHAAEGSTAPLDPEDLHPPLFAAEPVQPEGQCP